VNSSFVRSSGARNIPLSMVSMCRSLAARRLPVVRSAAAGAYANPRTAH
jgi:hypothetical protein